MAARASALETQLAGACRLACRAAAAMALALARRSVSKAALLDWAQQLQQVVDALRRLAA